MVQIAEIMPREDVHDKQEAALRLGLETWKLLPNQFRARVPGI